MAREPERLFSISHTLATVEQLSSSSSQLDGVPVDLESSIRLSGTELTQAAGILLHLPQETIAQAVVIFLRYMVGPEGGSFMVNAAKDVSAASLYMAAKISASPQSARAVLNVYSYLLSLAPPRFPVRVLSSTATEKAELESCYLSEGDYQSARNILFQTESIILRSLSFDTHVVLPHRLALTYLQTLGVLPSTPSSKSKELAKRTLAHLNTALFSPQLLYLTHQPSTLAVAAIYLAAREVGVKLSRWEWWEIFDVDREELGFSVVGLQSCEGWIAEERKRWMDSNCPLTVQDLQAELDKRRGAS